MSDNAIQTVQSVQRLGQRILKKHHQRLCENAGSVHGHHGLIRRLRMKKWQDEHKCAVCGKLIIATSLWAYKRGNRYYCSYTCYNKVDRRKKGAKQ